MASCYLPNGLMKPSRGQMLDLPYFAARLNFYARIKKARREIKARRRWLRAQRLYALRGTNDAPSWHPDADPRDSASR